MKASAWAPGHATLFFAVPNRYDNPLEMGSIGGGFNVDEGVETTVEISDAITNDIVYWNGKLISGEVTLTALKLFRERMKQRGIACNDPVQVNHCSNLFMGYGCSTSGAGTIGFLLAINKLYDQRLSDEEIYNLAHTAEILNHTGLGSVVGQMISGIELRASQGGPQVAELQRFDSDEPIILVFFAPLKTSEVLTSDAQMELVTRAGIAATQEARTITSDHVSQFITIGREFTNKCGLLTDKVRSAMIELEELGEDRVSMAMIGETLVIHPRNPEVVSQWRISKGIPDKQYLVTRISKQVPFVIKKS